MLTAALIVLLMGGGRDSLWLFPEKFSDQVKEVVSEEERQAEIIAIYDEIKENTESYDDEIRKMAEEMSLLNRKPEATETDFEQPIHSLLQKRKQIQSKYIDARLKMASQLNQDEWDKIFSVQFKDEGN